MQFTFFQERPKTPEIAAKIYFLALEIALQDPVKTGLTGTVQEDGFMAFDGITEPAQVAIELEMTPGRRADLFWS